MKINYDVDGEISLLGTCIFRENKLFEACQSLRVEHFHSPKTKIIFNVMSELYFEGSKVNLDAIVARLKIKGIYAKVEDVIGLLKPMSASSNFKSNLNNILTNFTKAKIAKFTNTLSDTFEERNIQSIASLCDSYLSNSSQVKTYTLQEIFEGEFYGESNFEEYLKKRMENYQKGNVISGISTGFKQLDKDSNGLNPGHYWVIAGVPGSGKTTYAIQIMKYLIQKKIEVGFISLEMIKEEASIKLISMDTKISYERISKGAISYKEQQEILNSMQLFVKNKYFKIQDGQIYDLFALRARMKQLVEVHGAKVLFIDYLTLIRNNEKSPNIADQVQAISSEIRCMLNELKVPGVIISQLNRSASDSTEAPQKHHLFGSGQIEKDAHLILMIHPHGISKRDRTVFIRKNRFGLDNVMLPYSFDNGIFEEVEFCYPGS